MKLWQNIKISFIYAFHGLKLVFHQERNFKIHIIIFSYVLYFAHYYDFTKTDYCVIFVVAALVLSLEVVNTSIEKIVNFISPEYNIFAGMIKDISAGSVLLVAIFAALIGFIYFFDIEKIIFIFNDIIFCWYKLLIFCIYSALSYVFISNKNKNQ